MPTPDHVLRLRASVGHDLLWLPGVHAVVLDDAGRVLLNRRSDTGRWAVLAGILEPGEEAADGAVREVHEETGVRVAARRVVSISTTRRVRYPNGDLAQYLDVTFACEYLDGLARVNDEESIEVGWFDRRALPELGAADLARIDLTFDADPAAHFAVTSAAGSPATERGEDSTG